MKSWTIAKKLTVSMVILIILSISILSVFAYELKQQSYTTQLAIENNVAPLIDESKVLNSIQLARVNLRDALFATQAGVAREKVESYRSTYQNLAQEVDRLINKLQQRALSPKAGQFLQEGVAGWTALKIVVGKIEKATIERDFDLAINLMLTECYVAAKSAVDGFNRFAEQQELEMKGTVDNNIQTTDSFTLTASVLALLAIATPVILSAWLAAFGEHLAQPFAVAP